MMQTGCTMPDWQARGLMREKNAEFVGHDGEIPDEDFNDTVADMSWDAGERFAKELNASCVRYMYFDEFASAFKKHYRGELLD